MMLWSIIKSCTIWIMMKITDIIPSYKELPFHERGNILYSGRRTNKDYFVVNYDTLRDRDPMNTPTELHNLVNSYSYDKFEVLVRNGLYASPNKKEAEYYGTLYRVFPLKYQMFTNPNIGDMTFSSGQLKREEQDMFAQAYVNDLIETIDVIGNNEHILFGEILLIREDLVV